MDIYPMVLIALIAAILLTILAWAIYAIVTHKDAFNDAVTFANVVNLLSADAVNAFNAVVEVLDDVYAFKAATEISTLADLDSNSPNLPSCVSFVDFAADAEEINEPLTTPI